MQGSRTLGPPSSGRRWLRAVLLAAALLGTAAALAAHVSAQEPAPAPARPDTAVVDSLPVSPAGALLRSLLLPGLGQVYVGAHARGALYFALESGSLWMVYKSSRGLAAVRERETLLREVEQLGPRERLPLARARAQQVEDWITLAVFWALFAGADAYVAAQLSDFAEHVGAVPAADGALRLQVRVPLGGGR